MSKLQQKQKEGSDYGSKQLKATSNLIWIVQKMNDSDEDDEVEFVEEISSLPAVVSAPVPSAASKPAVTNDSNKDKQDTSSTRKFLEKRGEFQSPTSVSDQNRSDNNESATDGWKERVEPRQGQGHRHQKPTAMQRARKSFEEKKSKKAADLKLRKENEAAKQAKYQQNVANRKANFKIYNRKTSKGQPLMKDRMNLLLQKIEKSL